jgi:hypothetical protein
MANAVAPALTMLLAIPLPTTFAGVATCLATATRNSFMEPMLSVDPDDSIDTLDELIMQV